MDFEMCQNSCAAVAPASGKDCTECGQRQDHLLNAPDVGEEENVPRSLLQAEETHFRADDGSLMPRSPLISKTRGKQGDRHSGHAHLRWVGAGITAR